MKRFIQKKMTLLFVPTCLLVSATAFGQSGECAEDADCAEGQFCQKAMFVDGCAVAPGEDGSECNTEPQVAETGTCITPPTPCESDADCGEYLACVESPSGDCAVDSEGNTYCGESDAEVVKYCSVAATPCETNDECPRDFECLEVSICLAVDCAEGDTECNDACNASGQKECQPKQIACDDSSECPSDWSCLGNYVESCSGGTSDGSSGSGSGDSAGSADGAEESDPVAPDEVTCTQEPAVGSCYPDAWSGGSYYANDGVLEAGAEGEPNTTGDSTSSGDSDGARAGGGCSVARGPRQPDFTWALGLLLALPLVRRRRAVA